jgi:hypothetical protein
MKSELRSSSRRCKEPPQAKISDSDNFYRIFPIKFSVEICSVMLNIILSNRKIDDLPMLHSILCKKDNGAQGTIQEYKKYFRVYNKAYFFFGIAYSSVSLSCRPLHSTKINKIH